LAKKICNESALSEVIGFVLILGLIVVLASLYLTYSVPAQGRENEILHMNEVKDQFVTYKVGLDSLFTNNELGTTISNSFNLGTSGGYVGGAFSFIPMMSPIASGGTVAINQRTTTPETLSVQSQSLLLNTTAGYAVDYSVGSPATINYTPSHIYLNISNIPSSGFRKKEGVYSWTVNSTSWTAIVNLSPQVTFYQSYQTCLPLGACGLCPGASQNGTPIDLTTSCLVPINNFNYTQSDLTLTVLNGNVYTIQNYPIYRNIRFDQVQPYTIDLMNNAYGISSAVQPPQSVALYPFDAFNTIPATGNVTYTFGEAPYVSTPIPLGSIEYRAQNNYWIPQDYYYQMGGVFLRQSDGNTTYKLPPEITFSYDNQTDPAKKIVTVNINALTIDQSNLGIVGGNSPVQIKTTLTNSTPFPYASASANTKWIRIGVNTSDSQARTMWGNYFNYTALVAGVPNFVVGQSGTESYIRIDGYDTTDNIFDINVIASNATYSTSVHGVGGIVQ
jgi:hypothetical protein